MAICYLRLELIIKIIWPCLKRFGLNRKILYDFLPLMVNRLRNKIRGLPEKLQSWVRSKMTSGKKPKRVLLFPHKNISLFPKSGNDLEVLSYLNVASKHTGEEPWKQRVHIEPRADLISGAMRISLIPPNKSLVILFIFTGKYTPQWCHSFTQGWGLSHQRKKLGSSNNDNNLAPLHKWKKKRDRNENNFQEKHSRS